MGSGVGAAVVVVAPHARCDRAAGIIITARAGGAIIKGVEVAVVTVIVHGTQGGDAFSLHMS